MIPYYDLFAFGIEDWTTMLIGVRTFPGNRDNNWWIRAYAIYDNGVYLETYALSFNCISDTSMRLIGNSVHGLNNKSIHEAITVTSIYGIL